MALVVPNYEALAAWAAERGITGDARGAGAAPGGRDHYLGPRDGDDGRARAVRKIKKLALLPQELSQEAGELTPTLKVKRRVVEERYRSLIDDMYQGAA